MPDLENVHFHFHAAFCLGHFLRSKIVSESSFLLKSYIITILNFFWSVSVKIKKKLKNWISHCIFKKWFRRGGSFSDKKKFWKSQNPQNMPKFQWWGGWCSIPKKSFKSLPPPTRGNDFILEWWILISFSSTRRKY